MYGPRLLDTRLHLGLEITDLLPELLPECRHLLGGHDTRHGGIECRRGGLELTVNKLLEEVPRVGSQFVLALVGRNRSHKHERKNHQAQ